MSPLDEEVVFFSRRRTTSSRRPGKTFDRPVAVRIVHTAPCRDCGGRRVAYSSAPHSPHANGSGRTVDCAGRALVRCSLPRCGWHLEGVACVLGGHPCT